MQDLKKRIVRSVVLICLCNVIITSVYADIAVIVHPTNNSVLDQKSIERIYMGKLKSFENGRSALPINASKGAATREEFNRLLMGRSDAQLTAFWSKLMFTGKGTPPMELATDQDILATVSANQDAIGYVDAASVTDTVKVVKIYNKGTSK